MFKTSVRGFKKSDVNNYIIAMHSEFADKKEALEEELAHNREELRMATVHLYIKDEMIRDLNAEIAALSSLSDENEKLTRENKKLTSEAALLQDKINSLTQEMSDILSRAAEAELKALELEAELLDADNLIGELRDEIEEAKEASSSKIRSRVSPAKVEAKEKDRYSFLSYVKRLFV